MDPFLGSFESICVLIDSCLLNFTEYIYFDCSQLQNNPTLTEIGENAFDSIEILENL